MTLIGKLCGESQPIHGVNENSSVDRGMQTGNVDQVRTEVKFQFANDDGDSVEATFVVNRADESDSKMVPVTSSPTAYKFTVETV